MDWFWTLVCSVVVLVLLKRTQRRYQKESDQRWHELTDRVAVLERALERALSAREQPPASGMSAAGSALPAANLAHESKAFEAAVAMESTMNAAASRQTFAGSAEPPLTAEPPISRPPELTASYNSLRNYIERARTDRSGKQEEKKSFRDRLPWTNLEETLGTNWLNKLGIVILVFGVAFFLAYQLRTLGPTGKIMVGYSVSMVLLGAGIFLEARERYRILARAAIAGGWALLFFTTYAMHHVAAARIVQSQIVDLVLMLVVAGAIVGHTLRYRSQVVTGFALLLALSTVTISRVDVYSLSAGAVLALALVVICVRMRWFELEVLGLLATYLNHYLWLRPIISPMQGHRHSFPEYFVSAAILLVYWAIFRASYLVRNVESRYQENVSSVAALTNTLLLLLLMKYQSVHREWAFWALLVVGAAELVLGQLRVARRRRIAFVVLTAMGTALVVAAFPFRYSEARLSVIWLAEAETLFLIGVWTREVVFRRLGMIAALIVSGQMIAVDAARVFGQRMDGANLSADPRLALVFASAAILLYGNSHLVAERQRELFNSLIDGIAVRRFSYVAGIMAIVAAWIAFPQAWTAVAWGAIGLGLAVAGWRLKLPDCSAQATAIGGLTVVRVLAINLGVTTIHYHITSRLITTSLVVAMLYLTSRYTDRIDWLKARRVPEAYLWATSALVAVLMWYELRPVSVVLGWVLFGLVLFELGIKLELRSLRLQAHAAMVLVFVRIFFVNLNGAGAPGQISPRVYTTLPLVFAFAYLYVRLENLPEDLPASVAWIRTASSYSYFAVITTAALMRFELSLDWVAAAWAAFTLLLIMLALRAKRNPFLHQALLLGFAVLFRATFHNFYERSWFPAPAWHGRMLCVGAAVALLFTCLPIAFRLRAMEDGKSAEKPPFRKLLLRFLVNHPEQVFFFLPLFLLTVLLGLEMRSGMVTLVWGIEGVVVFLVALWLNERSFRLSGLGLLLLCVGKIVVVDAWQLQPRDRYLTFIVLGCALLSVSFLYSRHREMLRQYL